MTQVRRYTVECKVDVSDDDVWAYLEDQGEDTDKLQEDGYELTDEDWTNAAEALFLDDDFTYYDFKEM